MDIPVNGGNWWFRYRAGNSCQIPSNTGYMTLCPNSDLRSNILGGSPRLNAIYVFYWKYSDPDLAPYRTKRAAIRNALESNNCPYKAMDATGLSPMLKFTDGGPYTCSNYV